jgi:hypothetical protein
MFKKPSAFEVNQLTGKQRQMLIDHIDGPLDITTRDAHLIPVRNSLIASGMLRPDTPAHIGLRPRTTILTERGRFALAAILANYAEALVRAGMMEARPIDILAQIKRSPRPVSPEAAEQALLPARMAAESFRK